jgi:GTP-binding protein
LKLTSCRFLRAVHGAGEDPHEPGPDVAFMGRSNVGKSSLLNRLVRVPGLARTSSRPGRTQAVCFYRLNERANLVDLPGYGWARVPEAVRRSWKALVEGYVRRRRERLALVVMLVDARHPPTALDLDLAAWLAAREIDFVVAATKSDKLGAGERGAARQRIAEALVAEDAARVLLVSAVNGSGVQELWRRIGDALAGWWERSDRQRGRRVQPAG